MGQGMDWLALPYQEIGVARRGEGERPKKRRLFLGFRPSLAHDW